MPYRAINSGAAIALKNQITKDILMKKLLLPVIFFSLLLVDPVFAADDGFASVEANLKKAMQSPLRTEKEIKRDRNRMPIETLKFFGLRSDMKVIELLPGGGWYTKLLAPVLAEDGELAVAIGTGRVTNTLVGKQGMGFLNVISDNSNIRREKGDRFYSLDKFDLGQTDTDMVFTFRNYHSFDFEARQLMNQAVFKALKSGGIYAVVDHTRRHMQQLDNENGRRVDPVLTIKEIQDAGFVLADYSDLHYHSDDELRYEVGRKTVTGNTDRFTLKFRKP
jgi:predicted methyltransferase